MMATLLKIIVIQILIGSRFPDVRCGGGLTSDTRSTHGNDTDITSETRLATPTGIEVKVLCPPSTLFVLLSLLLAVLSLVLVGKMRLRLFSLVVPLVLLSSSLAQDQASEPPSAASLIRRAKVLLQAGQHHEAAKSFSDAIELSPADMSLYYSRATAYYAINRHTSALDDIETVLRMSDNSFHQAFLMKARILAKEGDWTGSRNVLKQYTAKANQSDKEGAELVSALEPLNTEINLTSFILASRPF